MNLITARAHRGRAEPLPRKKRLVKYLLSGIFFESRARGNIAKCISTAGEQSVINSRIFITAQGSGALLASSCEG